MRLLKPCDNDFSNYTCIVHISYESNDVLIKNVSSSNFHKKSL